MRGYNREEVSRQINRAMECDREGLLPPQINNRRKKLATPLVLTSHPDLPFLMHILHDYQCIINTSP